jgi:serine O-acetyltransferase
MKPEDLWKLSSDLYGRGHRWLPRILKLVNYFIFRALLPPEVKVGVNLRLDHWALGVVSHPQVEIGDNCRIYHHVTLAAETWLGSPFKIIIGNNVTIGAHTIVVARQNSTLTIGDGSYIGAGSVLTKDVPPFEMWAGNPARKLGETVPGQAGSRGEHVRGSAQGSPNQH